MAWGAVAGAAVGLVGSSMAADAQSDAASSAAGASSAASRYSADLQKQMYDQTRTDQAPWRNTGEASLNKLSMLLGLGGQSSGSSGSGYLTEAQIRSQLAPNYTKTTSSKVPVYNHFQNDPAMPWVETVGWTNQNQSVVDENALNNAVRERLSEQDAQRRSAESAATDPQYGSLLKAFSMSDYEADPGYAFRLSEGQKALDRSAAARGGLQSGAALKAATAYGQDMGSQEYQNAYNRYQTNQSNVYNRLANIAGLGQTANNALQTAGTNYANSVGNLSMTNAANVGNAALSAGNSRASSYGNIGNVLGGINWGSLWKSNGSSNNNGWGYQDTGYSSGGYDW